MQNLSKEDALWLLNVFAPMRMGTIGGGTIQRFVKAINLMKGTNEGVPSCGCEYKMKAAIANSLFGQHIEQIKTIANAV
tara:strand:- start:3266 stop:3502 length:237 start_codon:yes stop_codon:yes gene_type:complete